MVIEKVVSEKLCYSENEILGKGTAGFVFRGSFDHDKIPVAVKRVQLASMQTEAIQKREEEALRGLDHPNVVKLYHVEEDKDFKYFVLELCCASLDQCFLVEKDPKKYKGPLPSDVEVLLQLSKGLEHIHSKNLVHRDVKPENIMISATEPVLVKWSDFGLCKPVNQRGSFSLSGIKGTQYWMAPEILSLQEQYSSNKKNEDSNKRGTIRSDIFALGLVFFNFLTNGLHLFGSKNLILTNVMRGKPTNLSKLPASHFAYDAICGLTKSKPEERIALPDVINKLQPHNKPQTSAKFHVEDSESL